MGMGVGGVAERSGCAASAIRYYEEIELLGEVRREGGAAPTTCPSSRGCA